jgi:hypothetical protein
LVFTAFNFSPSFYGTLSCRMQCTLLADQLLFPHFFLSPHVLKAPALPCSF